MKIVLDHIVLNVRDALAAVDFYGRILGLEIERLEKFERGIVPYPSVRINDETLIDLFPPKMWRGETGESVSGGKINLHHFCLTLDEHQWKELVNRLHENGVEITRYADDNWGAQGGGVSVYFNDLDGNEVEARYYRNE
jgi:catechol 2,3-dioxygenase-like lactoylglutathione lyase family enzyme